MEISKVFNLIMKKDGMNNKQFVKELGYSLKYFHSVKYSGVKITNAFFEKMYKIFPNCKEEIDNLKKISLIREKEREDKKAKRQKIGIQTVKNNWLYRVHFYFSKNGETYKCWGYEIPMEEAEKVVKKIKKFLKEHNNIELK